METAAVGGAAHLVNFMGTDTVPALVMLRDFYGAKMAGFSIPASEHSTITAWGRAHEVDAMRNMLEQFPSGLMACVSDSFDIWLVRGVATVERARQSRPQRGAAPGLLPSRPGSHKPAFPLPAQQERLHRALGQAAQERGHQARRERRRACCPPRLGRPCDGACR